MAAGTALWGLASHLQDGSLAPRWPSLCWAREPCCPRPWVAAERTGRMSGGWERWVLGGLGAPGVRPSHRALAHAWGPSEPCSGHLAVQDRAGHPAAHRAPPPPPPHHLPSPIRRLVFPRPSSASRRLVSLSCSQALLGHPESPGGDDLLLTPGVHSIPSPARAPRVATRVRWAGPAHGRQGALPGSSRGDTLSSPPKDNEARQKELPNRSAPLFVGHRVQCHC